MNEKKEEIRNEFANRENRTKPGRIAERLRRLTAYREATTIFVESDEMLHQIRINCLVDGKNLVMPGPGLKEGFFLLAGRSVPFRNLNQAVTFRGLPRYGRRLPLSDLADLAINLLITGAVAVDQNGTRLGRGQGFFDLSAAILNDSEALAPEAQILAVIEDDRFLNRELPAEPWDVIVNGVLVSTGFHELNDNKISCCIHWDLLSPKKIKKLSPLWQLRRHPMALCKNIK